MTRIRDATLFLALAASTVIAFAQVPERPTPQTAQPGQMQQMQSRMQSMHETMERIHATQDPAERQRLMQEHRQAMHEGMAMMSQMMGGPGGNAVSRCREDDAVCRMDRMQMQQGAMTERMETMQQMMQQMMDHMMQREAAPTPSPETQQPPATEQNHAEHH